MILERPSSDKSNRRKSYRIHCGLKAAVRIEGVGQLPTSPFKDASRDGVGIYSWEPIRPDQEVTVGIPDLGESVQIEGTVVRCHQTPEGRFEIGIQISPENARRYGLIHEDLCEIEYYRKTVEDSRKQRVSSTEALGEWRRKFTRSRANFSTN